MINKIMKNLQIARKSLIYTDSTGADKVAPAEKNSTDVSAASAAFSISAKTCFFFNINHFWKSENRSLLGISQPF